MKTNKAENMEKSEVIEEMPVVCSDELAAVEFFERKIWNGTPVCPHCKSTNVYQMKDLATGQRNKRFLWRCRSCKEQFTVRIGTVLEESRIPFRHWAYAFWRAVTSKKGVSALEIKRQCQISYPAALFLMHRVRFAMTPQNGASQKLSGIVECDETYIGGKPRAFTGFHKPGRGTKKTPVFGMVERDGNIHRRVVANVSGKTLKSAIRECVDKDAMIITDEWPAYRGIGKEFGGGHAVINHGLHQYANGGNFNQHGGKLVRHFEARHYWNLPFSEQEAPAPLRRRV
jgi:transposase-like protein